MNELQRLVVAALSEAARSLDRNGSSEPFQFCCGKYNQMTIGRMQMMSSVQTMVGNAQKTDSVTGARVADERASRLFASMDQSKFSGRHAALYATVIFFHFFDGFDVLMIGTVLPGVVATFKLTSVEAGMLVSSVFFGMLVGAILITMLADRIGRKNALFLAIGWYAVFSLVAMTATSYHELLVIRLLEGLGLGAEDPLDFTYVVEFVPSRKRGFLAASSVFFWLTAGGVASLTAILIVPLFTWRGMFGLGAIPAILLVVAWRYVPESIRYLVSRNKIDEAEVIVRRFSTVDLETVDPKIVARQLPQNAVAATTRFTNIFRGGYLRYTLTIWGVNFGSGMVFFGLSAWLPSIFIRMGYTMVHSFAFSGLIATAGAVGCLCQALLLDIFGRRLTIGISFLIGGVAMLAWGGATSIYTIMGLGALTAFTGAGGVTGCIHTYNVELYPTQNRATGAGFATAWQRMGGIVAPMLLGVFLAGKLPLFTSFAFLSAIMIINGIVALTLLFETKGKSLEQIAAGITANG
jgi:putative MFS transporter